MIAKAGIADWISWKRKQYYCNSITATVFSTFILEYHFM